MNLGFWGKIKKPIMALAPMANVTDAAFRRIIAKYGKPDVFFTEFTSVEGLLSRGKEKLLVDLWYSESERPIVAQIFGGKPEQFFEVAKLCAKLKFDGIDINMGCPDKGVEKSGGGAALITNPKLAAEIIKATQEGAPNLPISVKTRIGYNKIELDTWIPALLETDIAALIVHLRTRKEMSFVPAHWELVPEIMRIALHATRYMNERTLILGNGDVQTVAEAKEKSVQYGLDGVMIGRGIFGNPWLFARANNHPELVEGWQPTIEEKLRVCLEHTKLFEELFGSRTGATRYTLHATRLKPFDIMKKHYKAYINGFPGSKELRSKLMEAKDVSEVEKILKTI
ncbi:MAG: tRNA-dihydrouridine synthase [bacterium]|nr:tRNA-dihydrouridine synthase [bacterium]